MRREILGSAVSAKYRVAGKNRQRFCMLEDYFVPSALGTLNAASLGRWPKAFIFRALGARPPSFHGLYRSSVLLLWCTSDYLFPTKTVLRRPSPLREIFTPGVIVPPSGGNHYPKSQSRLAGKSINYGSIAQFWPERIVASCLLKVNSKVLN